MWIFLDIDGVLVPDKNKFHGSAIKEDFFKFDPVCQKEFEDVLRLYPEVSVVISSSWREVSCYAFKLGIPHCLFPVARFL